MLRKPSDGRIAQKRRERILGCYRAKGVQEDDLPPEWLLELTDELWSRGGVEGQELWDLVNTSKPYPKAVPILLDWLEHLDERVTPPATRWDIGTRRGLNRALAVEEAKGTIAAELMIAQFHHDPAFDEETLFTAANALKHLAKPEHFDHIAQIVHARLPGRSPLIEWLGKSRRKEALGIVAAQLDDPEVASWTMKTLRRKALPPEIAAEVRPRIERYLDWPGDKDKLPGELRKQAKLTMDKLYPAA